MHAVLFGIAFILSINSPAHSLNFLVSTVIFLLVTLVLLPKSDVIYDIKKIKRINFLSFFLGPFMYLILMIQNGIPFMSENPNIQRVIIRDIFIIDYLVLPSVTIYTCTLFYLRNKDSKLKLIFSLFFLSIVGILSGFRAAAITPFFLFFLFLFVTNRIRINLKNISLIILGSLLVLFILVYITQVRAGIDNSIYSILYSRIFLENAVINFNRYMRFYLENGLMFGGTYIQDFCSVVGLGDQSFQEMLSGGGKLVMNTPFYAEIFLNFGWFSVLGALLLGLTIGILLMVLNTIFKDLKVFLPFIYFYMFPSMLQAGITKYMFVVIPKVIIVLVIFKLIFLFLGFGSNKYNFR